VLREEREQVNRIAGLQIADLAQVGNIGRIEAVDDTRGDAWRIAQDVEDRRVVRATDAKGAELIKAESLIGESVVDLRAEFHRVVAGDPGQVVEDLETPVELRGRKETDSAESAGEGRNGWLFGVGDTRPLLTRVLNAQLVIQVGSDGAVQLAYNRICIVLLSAIVRE